MILELNVNGKSGDMKLSKLWGVKIKKKEDFTIIQKTKYSKDKISMLELQVLSMMGVFPA